MYKNIYIQYKNYYVYVYKNVQCIVYNFNDGVYIICLVHG